MTDQQIDTNPKTYIGLLDPYSDEFASAVMSRASSWSKNTISNGQQRQWYQNYRLYYNADPDTYGNPSPGFGAESFSVTNNTGDVVRANYNIFRNIITNILNMTVNQPPALDVKAANSEPDSLVASQLFKDVLDFYVSHWKNARFKKQTRKAVEYCLFMSNGYILIEWDAAGGNPYMQSQDGGVVRDGDIYIKARSVWDVFFDVNCEDDDELDWMIVRDYINKFELAARYPGKRDEILALAKKTELEVYRSWGWDDETDLVPIYKYFHRSTATLPNGRFAIVCDGDLVLYDGGNPYIDEFKQAIIPVLTVRAADGVGTLYGYSPGNDLAPPQVAFNTAWTAILTNLSAFGIQNVVMDAGQDINVEQLQGALNIIEVQPGSRDPRPLQLSAITKDSYTIPQQLEHIMEGISGMNSVVRGDPDSALKAASGRALGLLQAMAVQFNSGLQDSYQQLLKDCGNLILRILRAFAKTDRVTQLVGRDKAIRLSQWNGDSFKNVGSVVAEQVNPMSKTTAGNRDEAEFLVQNHIVNDAHNYLLVRDTGRMDPLTMPDQTQNNLIQQENEQLLNGRAPPVMKGDKHDWHISDHLALLASPQVRLSSNLVKTVLTHVQWHEDQVQAENQQKMAASAPPGFPPVSQPPPAPNAPPTANRKAAPESPTMPGPTGGPVPVPKTSIAPGVSSP